jgi:hypothetical protein
MLGVAVYVPQGDGAMHLVLITLPFLCPILCEKYLEGVPSTAAIDARHGEVSTIGDIDIFVVIYQNDLISVAIRPPVGGTTGTKSP